MAKNNYSDIFKQKTKGNLKLKICYKKYCEYCTSKNNNNNNKSFFDTIIRVELVNFY